MIIKKLVFTLVFFLGVLLLLSAIGEIGVRAFYPAFTNYNMEMWRYASHLKKPLQDEKLPFHHFAGKEGDFYGVQIKTNSFGFRDREFTIQKPEGKKRVIFSGDSFTLGWGVPFEDLYSKQLEKRLNAKSDDYEVINMGIGNYNSSMEVELFKKKGLRLDPDIVVLMYFINDAEPTPARLSAFEYNIRKNSYFFALIYDRYVKLKRVFAESFDWRSYYSNLYDDDSAALKYNKESIQELIDICNENNIELLIVSIPELHDLEDYPFPFVTRYLRNIADENGVPFLDLLPSLVEEEPESLWVSAEDPHANSKANSIIADEILQKINESGFR